MIIFGLLSMGIAVPFILVQRSFRRILAYSSIDHGGIMVLGLGFGGPLGALGMMLHMTFHSITKPLIFFCAGNVQQHLKTDQFRRTGGGLIHFMPITGAAFMMAMFAVTGSPPFSMFQSEFTILRAAFDGGHTFPAVAFIAFLVAIFAGFLVHIARMVLGPDPGCEKADLCPYKTIPLVALSSIILILGFWIPAPLYALVQKAASIVVEVR
jgi:hydrogenase-4 component F